MYFVAARFLSAFLVFAGCSYCLELVHLSNDFTLQATSHRNDGEFITLFTATGSLQFPTSAVLSIESQMEPPAEGVKSALPTLKDPKEYLAAAASHQGLPSRFVTSVAAAESGLKADAVSRKGAIGLMQLLPSTAAELGIDPKRVSENSEGGAKYLRSLLLRYHGDAVLALAAYNAGPGAVAKYGGVPPFPETHAYILRVLQLYAHQRASE